VETFASPPAANTHAVGLANRGSRGRLRAFGRFLEADPIGAAICSLLIPLVGRRKSLA
jgi:hypothetical protein